MASDSAVERVARALFEAWAKHRGSRIRYNELLRDVEHGKSRAVLWHDELVLQARAAIAAMQDTPVETNR